MVVVVGVVGWGRSSVIVVRILRLLLLGLLVLLLLLLGLLVLMILLLGRNWGWYWRRHGRCCRR